MNTDFTSIASVDADLRAICVELPDRLNPTTSDDGAAAICVYDNAKGEHCIVGELLYRNGLLTTEIIRANETIDNADAQLGMAQDILNRMRLWQSAADLGAVNPPWTQLNQTNPIPWGKVPAMIAAYDEAQSDKEHDD